MKIDQWLKESSQQLQTSGVATARLDCLVLLEDATDKDRSWLLAHPETEITSRQDSELASKVTRRSKHEPLAYIRGKTEFYGREFIVNEHTLEPRPESETIIDLLKTLPNKSISSIIDAGTGSGCLAITAGLEFPDLEICATDIDKGCIQTANQNAEKHGVNTDFRHGNLLEPFLSELTSGWSIVANLPYVPDDHIINTAAMFEPKHAIFGGVDGLDLYREMFTQTDKLKSKPRYILTESLPFQHNDLSGIAKNYGYKQLNEVDFIQVFAG